MKNKEAKIILIKDYGKICFLGGNVTKYNYLTVHHLKPIRAGGKTILANLALLTRLQHDKFNTIEHDNRKKAKEINDYLRYFKETRDMIAREQMRIYIENEIKRIGYVVEGKGKKIALKRR